MNNESDLLIDQLSEEFTSRCRAGENPSIDEYASQHPQIADQIRKIFPSIAMMEKLSIQQHSGVKLAQHIASNSRLPFEKLGDFELVREVGRGGMGIVYEAVQESLERNVAVKVLSLQAKSDEKHLRRFEREARTASKLHHTNIVPVFGVGQADGYNYIVMQLIDGVGIDSIIKSYRRYLSSSDRINKVDILQFAGNFSVHPAQASGRTQERPFQDGKQDTYTDLQSSLTRPKFDEQLVAQNDKHSSNATEHLGENHFLAVAEIGIQVAGALAYAHQQKILHRDIKPGNLLVDESKNVWIVDFGLAKAFEHDDVTRTNDVVGTLKYMAPEQIFSAADERSDIYSLGLTLYELLTLQPAYDDTNLKDLFQDRKQVRIPKPSQLFKSFPLDLETIVLKCCAHDPDERYQNATDLVDDLNAFTHGLPIQARPWTPVEKLTRWCRVNPVEAGLSAATLVLLVVAATLGCIGYIFTNAAYQRELTARTRAIEQKQKAEDTLEISLQALNRIYANFVPDQSAYEIEFTDDENNSVAVSYQPVLSKETAKILEELLTFYNRFSDQYRDRSDLKRSIAMATIKIGDIHKQLGHFKDAELAYLDAVETTQYFADRILDLSSILELVSLRNRLGEVYVQQGKMDEAKGSFQLARGILENRLDADPENVDLKLQLARTFYLIGRSGVPKSNRPQSGTDPVRHGVSSFAGRSSNPPKSKTNPSLDQAIEILQTIEKQSPGQQFLLALCYQYQPVELRENLEKSQELLSDLCAQFPHNSDYLFALGETHARLALRNSAPESIEHNLREALNYITQLAASHPNIPKYDLAKAVNQFKLAAHLARQSRPPFPGFPPRRPPDQKPNEAIELIDNAIETQTKLTQRFPDNPEYAGLLGKLKEFKDRLDKRRPRKNQPPADFRRSSRFE